MTAERAAPSATLRALLERLVDYAGLFPPASLSMTDAVARFAAHRRSPEAWMLARFVVPIGRLDALAAGAAAAVDEREGPWTLSALLGADPAAEAERVRAFNDAHRGRLVVDAVEFRAAAPADVDAVTRRLDRELAVFVEIAAAEDPRPMLDVVKRHDARAKVRTGGVTAGAIPSVAALARFIAGCAERELPFKATAGLHHPLRGEHPLTYDDASPTATMFGFVNVFAAAAFARAGLSESGIATLLDEREADAFSFGDDALVWRGHRLDRRQLADSRHALAIGFGSCSFAEPVADLHALALL